jgi:hypothetical protein
MLSVAEDLLLRGKKNDAGSAIKTRSGDGAQKKKQANKTRTANGGKKKKMSRGAEGAADSGTMGLKYGGGMYKKRGSGHGQNRWKKNKRGGWSGGGGYGKKNKWGGYGKKNKWGGYGKKTKNGRWWGAGGKSGKSGRNGNRWGAGGKSGKEEHNMWAGVLHTYHPTEFPTLYPTLSPTIEPVRLHRLLF